MFSSELMRGVIWIAKVVSPEGEVIFVGVTVRFLRLPLGGATVIIWGLLLILVHQMGVLFTICRFIFPDVELFWWHEWSSGCLKLKPPTAVTPDSSYHISGPTGSIAKSPRLCLWTSQVPAISSCWTWSQPPGSRIGRSCFIQHRSCVAVSRETSQRV